MPDNEDKEEDEAKVEKVEKDEVKADMEYALKVFHDSGNIVYFPTYGIVYTDGMKLVAMLKTILRSVMPSGGSFKNARDKGMLNKEDLDLLCEDAWNRTEDLQQIKDILLQLKLAWEISNDKLFVPSLINEDNCSKIKNEVSKIFANRKNEWVGIEFRFTKMDKSVSYYHKLLASLLNKEGVSYFDGFAQKIETRTGKVISGMTGKIDITISDDQKKSYKIVMLE